MVPLLIYSLERHVVKQIKMLQKIISIFFPFEPNQWDNPNVKKHFCPSVYSTFLIYFFSSPVGNPQCVVKQNQGYIKLHGGTAKMLHSNLEGPGHSNVVPKCGCILLCKGIIFHSDCINAFANSTPVRKKATYSCDRCKAKTLPFQASMYTNAIFLCVLLSQSKVQQLMESAFLLAVQDLLILVVFASHGC